MLKRVFSREIRAFSGNRNIWTVKFVQGPFFMAMSLKSEIWHKEFECTARGEPVIDSDFAQFMREAPPRAAAFLEEQAIFSASPAIVRSSNLGSKKERQAAARLAKEINQLMIARSVQRRQFVPSQNAGTPPPASFET